jgi:hypothetical protein
MTRTYPALVIEIDKVVDEVVTILVEGITVRCFASYCPMRIEVGKTYEVEFEITLPDELCVLAVSRESSQINMIDNGLSCDLSGFLDGSTFRSFVDFHDQDIHYEYPHLNEHYIQIRIQRIDVIFCQLV